MDSEHSSEYWFWERFSSRKRSFSKNKSFRCQLVGFSFRLHFQDANGLSASWQSRKQKDLFLEDEVSWSGKGFFNGAFSEADYFEEVSFGNCFLNFWPWMSWLGEVRSRWTKAVRSLVSGSLWWERQMEFHLFRTEGVPSLNLSYNWFVLISTHCFSIEIWQFSIVSTSIDRGETWRAVVDLPSFGVG